MLHEAKTKYPTDKMIKKELDYTVAFDLVFQANLLSTRGNFVNDHEEVAKAAAKYQEALSLVKNSCFIKNYVMCLLKSKIGQRLKFNCVN